MSGDVVHRLYWDFEKEERWLNEMAAGGSHLVRYTWGAYHFEHGDPGEWIYRIELLRKSPRDPASREYLSFLSDTGAETVCTYMNWVYLRRPASLGAFELFSDLESRIAHYRRVLALFTSVFAASLPVAVSCMLSVQRSRGLPMMISLAIVVAAMALLAVLSVRVGRRVSSLKAQRQIYE